MVDCPAAPPGRDRRRPPQRRRQRAGTAVRDAADQPGIYHVAVGAVAGVLPRSAHGVRQFADAKYHAGSMQPILFEALSLNHKLDRGNPNAGNIGSDFHQLGVRIWPRMTAVASRNAQRQQLLDELVEWRNAIAHQNFDPARLGGTVVLRLERVRSWRGACEALARSMDQVLQSHLGNLLGILPW
jgi:hypothetical protein